MKQALFLGLALLLLYFLARRNKYGSFLPAPGTTAGSKPVTVSQSIPTGSQQLMPSAGNGGCTMVLSTDDGGTFTVQAPDSVTTGSIQLL